MPLWEASATANQRFEDGECDEVGLKWWGWELFVSSKAETCDSCVKGQAGLCDLPEGMQ